MQGRKGSSESCQLLCERGEDGDFPDFREVVAALFVLLHKYSHQEDLALGLLNVQATAWRSAAWSENSS